MFDSALEQAEQLFKAASGTPVQARPILLFYGVTQIGRAIAAASPILEETEWRLRAHGLHTPDPSALDLPLADVVVRDQSGAKAAFTTVCRAVNAGSLAREATLGDLWPLLPETHRQPLVGANGIRPLLVAVDGPDVWTALAAVTVSGLPSECAEQQRDPISDTDWDAERQKVQAYLDRFPGLKGMSFTSMSGQPVGLQNAGDGTYWVRVRLPVGPAETMSDVLGTRTFIYPGAIQAVWPSFGESSDAQHPFMVWWAILYVLSITARYQPERWAAVLDVSNSADAVPVEHVLGEALKTLPELAHRVLFAL